MATETLSVHPRGFLTPDDARSFDGYSVANAVAVRQALGERGCSCEPYEDVFTFNRWRAQGRIVRRGQHGIALRVYVTATARGEDADGGSFGLPLGGDRRANLHEVRDDRVPPPNRQRQARKDHGDQVPSIGRSLGKQLKPRRIELGSHAAALTRQDTGQALTQESAAGRQAA